jgi:hypothetical protein
MRHLIIIKSFIKPIKNNNSMENKTKRVEIEIPVGKVAKWVDGVLTLVDEKPQDVTERIKTFEEAYKCSETYTDRAKIEKAELHERMTRLEKFIRSENFDNLDDEEQSLLLGQFGAMLSYFHILKRRIAKAEN